MGPGVGGSIIGGRCIRQPSPVSDFRPAQSDRPRSSRTSSSSSLRNVGKGEGEGADLAPTPESIAAQEAYGEAVGVRLDDAAHTLSIRRDAKYPVLLFVTQ